jgi:hypothetical protein
MPPQKTHRKSMRVFSDQKDYERVYKKECFELYIVYKIWNQVCRYILRYTAVGRARIRKYITQTAIQKTMHLINCYKWIPPHI